MRVFFSLFRSWKYLYKKYLAVPETKFWTGIKRNPPDGYSAGEWVGNFYRAESTSIKWLSGYTGDETGDCLAMEVLPIGIGYYPMDCTTKLDVICHKFPGIDVSIRRNYLKKRFE